MARRKSKAEGVLILGLIVVAAPIYLAIKIVETVGWIFPILLIAGAGVAFYLYRKKKAKDRLDYLLGKYKDEEVVSRILGGYFWQGQTKEQLVDSIGNPLAIDSKVLRSAVREVWKYSRTGRNRYGLRVTLEDGVVVGWDNKAG